VPRLSPPEWGKRAATLRRHGATPEEIAFLSTRRVELNAMTSRQLVDFVETKLAEHGVRKLIPHDDVIEKHARRVIKERLVAKISDEFEKEAAKADLPEDLRRQIEDFLQQNPELPWDAAVAQIIDAGAP
jgi:hypothetical protein